MSGGTDPDSTGATYLALSKGQVMLEVARASYAVGIGTALTTVVVCGVLVLGIELPEAIVFTGFVVGFGFVPAGLYFYDWHHKRDLVIADLGHTIVRPVAVLYRILRAP